MIIQCGNCERKFKIEDSRIKPPGNRVRCSKCGHVFFVEARQEESDSETETQINREEEPLGTVSAEKLPDEAINRTQSAGEIGSQGGFDWENLTVGSYNSDSSEVEPELVFDNESEKLSYGGVQEPLDSRERPESPSYTVQPDSLALDQDIFLSDHSSKSFAAAPTSTSSAPRSHRYKMSSSGSGILKRLAYTSLTLLVLLVITCAATVILVNVGFIPAKDVDAAVSLFKSKLPPIVVENGPKDVIVSEVSGKWISTPGGAVYFVSGFVVNRSDRPVNYVQIKSEFSTKQENLYKQVVYAGNTLTEGELKTLSMKDVLSKLRRKSGDVDVKDPESFAGLNYGIDPGESVPFYSVFPSQNPISDLSYKVQVLDFETSLRN